MKELKDNFFISLGTVDHNFAPMYCSLCLPDCFVTECRKKFPSVLYHVKC